MMMISKRLFVAATMVLSVGCLAEVEDDLGDSEFKQTEQEVIIANLVDAGFPEDDIMVDDEGRVIVGNDAVVTMQASRELAGIITDGEERDDEFRQYRTTNTVNTGVVSTICVNPSVQWEGNGLMLQALDVAIGHYNDQNLQFTMARDGAGCNAGTNGTLSGSTWTLAANLDNSGGGVAGFPSGGMPYTDINVDQNLAANYGIPVATHVIQHELGHCVGFRHTDYYDRSISCGGAKSNEGDAGVGAIHIDGTPTTAVLNGSVMNSCYSVNSNGLWTAGDITALDCLYDTGSCAPPPPPTYDVNLDTQANLSAGSGTTTQYGPYDATGRDALMVSISGGSGDADLYVKFGSAPTTNSYDCRPYVAGNAESCEFNPSQDGDYYVMIRAYSNYSGVTLSVNAAGGGAPPPPPPAEVCDNGVDDDGDGDTDCSDSDCAGDPACAGGGPVCGDGVCDGGESCDGRNGTTSCSADCDGVTGGKPSNRYCYVGGVCEGPGCP